MQLFDVRVKSPVKQWDADSHANAGVQDPAREHWRTTAPSSATCSSQTFTCTGSRPRHFQAADGGIPRYHVGLTKGHVCSAMLALWAFVGHWNGLWWATVRPARTVSGARLKTSILPS